MSDDLVKSLQSEISRLNQELANTRAEAKKYRLARKDSNKELDELRQIVLDLEKERNEWEGKAKATPGEQAKELETLKTQIKSRDIKDKFRPIESQLGEKLTIDHLFKLAEFDPAQADLEALNVDELVKGWRESFPAMFKPPETGKADPGGSQRQPLRTEMPTGRGNPDLAATRVTYRKADVARAGWQTERPDLVKALQSGNAVLVE